MKIQPTSANNRSGMGKLRWYIFNCLCILACVLSAPTFAQQTGSRTSPTFNIFEYRVEGNSRLSDDQIGQAVTPYLGEQKSFQDVAQAREHLEQAYHDAGYMSVIVTIPEQKVDENVVTLLVHEVPVERLRVIGSNHHEEESIKALVPELAEGNVPNFPVMQKQLAAANHSPDMKVTPILRSGATPGSVEAELDIDDQLPLHGNIELSNRQSPNTTPERLAASIHYDNLFQDGQTLGLSTQLSPQKTDEVRVVSLNYMLPLDVDGDALTLYAVHSRSSLATIANSPGLGVLGNTDIFGSRYALALKPLDGYVHNASFGLEFKRVKQSITTKTGSTTTPLSYVPLVATYIGNMRGENSSTTFEATATMGVRGLFGNTDTEFLSKRSQGGSANYFVMRSDVQHTENFGEWSAFGKLEFQGASGPLVSNEQFTAGGAESVRGYLEGELAGDDALHGTLELRTPEFKPAGVTSLWGLIGLVFYDAADLRTSYAQAPQLSNQSIHSAGFGLQTVAPRGFTLQLYWAHAFDKAEVTKAGSNRLQAHLEWDY